MPPQEPDAWDGILECKNFGPVAKQIVPWYPDSVQNEKALFSVNVSTRELWMAKRPVMLWLYGGGFDVGASNNPMTYGKALAKKGDVVIVSVITG